MSFTPGVPLSTDAVVLDMDAVRRIEGAGIGVSQHAIGASTLTSPLLSGQQPLPAVPHNIPWPQPLVDRLPHPTDKLTLESMPEDAVVSVLTYLAAEDVARACATSKCMNIRASDAGLWVKFFVQDFDIVPRERKLLSANPKRCYESRVLQHKSRVAIAIQERETNRGIDAATSSRERWQMAVVVYTIFALQLSPVILLISFLALLSTKLDNDSDISWWTVGIPIWIWVGLWALLVFISFVILKCNDISERTSVWYNFSDSLTWLPGTALIRLSQSSSRRWLGMVHMTCLLFALIAIPVTLIARAQHGDSNFPWAAALSPFWLLVLLCACNCCVYPAMRGRDATQAQISLWCSVICPIFVVLILMCVSIDGDKAIALQKLFIPFWIPLGMVALTVCCGACISVGKCCWDRDVGECGMFCGMLFATTALVAPPILSLVFWVLKVEDVHVFTWREVIAPMWAFLIVAEIVMCVGAGFVAWDKLLRPWMERRQLQQDPFAP